MSINLMFNVKGGGFVEFPYQTRTSLTYAVLNAPTYEEKIKLIEESMKDWEDEEWKKEKLEEVKVLLKNPNLELSCI